LDALKSADLQGAEKALTDLWSFDPILKNDPYLIKISQALSKKLLYLAQKTALEMQADTHHFSSHLSTRPSVMRDLGDSALKPGSGKTQVQTPSEPNMKKATSGEFGRIIDVTA